MTTPATTEVKHEEHGSKGAFYIDKDGQRAATMTYTRAGDDLIIIDHTEVGEALKGHGAGKQMVVAAVEWARASGLHIIPLCPFARATFEKDPSLRDVLST